MKTFGFKIDKDGRIPNAVNEALRDFFFSRRNKDVELTVKDKRGTKSHEQLGYWFGLVVPIFSKHTGHSEKEIHDILKYRAGYVEGVEIDGNKLIKIKSLAEASKMDMMAIIEETKKWAEFLNLQIPEPDPFWKDK